MLLGVFGLPGGAEIVIIIGVVVLLFVPSLAMLWIGYVLGRRSALAPSAGPDVPAMPPGEPEPASDQVAPPPPLTGDGPDMSGGHDA